jgi:hypothetical protein
MNDKMNDKMNDNWDKLPEFVRISPYYASPNSKRKDIAMHQKWIKENKVINRIKYKVCV